MIIDQLRSHYDSIGVDEAQAERVATSVKTAARARHRPRWLAPAGAALVAACVAAVVVVVGVIAGGGSRGDHDHATAVAPRTTSTPPRTPPAPRWSTAPALARLTPTRIVSTFTSLLPSKWTVHTIRTDAKGFVVDTVIDDGAGAAQVSISLAYPPRHHWETEPVGCRDEEPGGDGTCTVTPQGYQVFTLKSYEYPADPSRGAKEWYTEIWRPERFKVSIHEWNAPAEKDAAITRPDPPLTLRQMRTIAASPVWTS